jgi:hypothetical protein
MRRFLVRLSESEASNHTRSLADFTITTPEFKFSVHTIEAIRRRADASRDVDKRHYLLARRLLLTECLSGGIDRAFDRWSKSPDEAAKILFDLLHINKLDDALELSPRLRSLPAVSCVSGLCIAAAEPNGFVDFPDAELAMGFPTSANANSCSGCFHIDNLGNFPPHKPSTSFQGASSGLVGHDEGAR